VYITLDLAVPAPAAASVATYSAKYDSVADPPVIVTGLEFCAASAKPALTGVKSAFSRPIWTNEAPPASSLRLPVAASVVTPGSK
jgi:hypothetical protein